MDKDNSNINIDDGDPEHLSEEEIGEEEQENEEDEEESQEEDENEDQEDEKASYKERTRERFEKLTADLKETKESNKQLLRKIDLLTQTVDKLSADNLTAGERDKGIEILERIKKLDEEGLDSYESLAKLVTEYTKAEIDKAVLEKEKANKEKVALEIREINRQLDELVELGELKENEKKEFLLWCSDKLDETKSPEHPEGNVRIYGDPLRAIYYYRKYQEVSKKQHDSNFKNRTERSGTPPSSSDTSGTVVKVSLEDLKNMTLADALRRKRQK